MCQAEFSVLSISQAFQHLVWQVCYSLHFTDKESRAEGQKADLAKVTHLECDRTV